MKPGHMLLAPLRGEVSLQKAWWLYGLGMNVVALSFVGLIRLVTGTEGIWSLFAALPFAFYWSAGVWKCAYNCKSRAFGTYVRACVVASFVGFAIIGILFFLRIVRVAA